jgi:hypothetical protein
MNVLEGILYLPTRFFHISIYAPVTPHGAI